MDGKRRRSISFTPAILDLAVDSAVRLVACAGSLLLLLAVCASAQTQGDAFASRIPPNVSANAVLAQGDPPLTESMVDLYANFEAWLMEIPRTQLQRNGVRAMIIEDWKKPAEIKNDMMSLRSANFAAPPVLLQDSQGSQTADNLRPFSAAQICA